MRAVIDTNIIVSAMFWRGMPGAVYDAAIAEKFTLLATSFMVAELERVLHYPKFATRLTTSGISANELLDDFLSVAEIVVQADFLPDIVRDPNDAPILACAIGGKADVIVSGDQDLLVLQAYQNIPILDAARFLERLAKA